MIEVIEEGYDWAYSLRAISSKEGHWECMDNCESLGKWPTWNSPNTLTLRDPQYHIDTSCFAVPREILVKGIAGAWYGKWGADRQFFKILKQHYPKFGCTNQHTLNYRLSGNAGSVTKEFFLQGNKFISDVSPLEQPYPWHSKR
jgi:hypothetical protein